MSHSPAEIAFGPMFIGTILNVLLYGIMITQVTSFLLSFLSSKLIILQVYLYFITYKNDRPWMKILVAGVFLADTANAIFDIVFVYHVLVTHFGEALEDPISLKLIQLLRGYR